MGIPFLALYGKILLSISSIKCLYLLFMIHLLYVWLQQRSDRQKGKRMDIREIKDSEPKYPNLALCSDEIKAVILKSENLLTNHKLSKNPKPRIQQRN